MAGLQRSAISFRRQGSSGFVWDDNFLSGELNQVKSKDQQEDGEKEKPRVSRPPRMQPDGEKKKPGVPRPPPQVKRSQSTGESNRCHIGKDVGEMMVSFGTPPPQVKRSRSNSESNRCHTGKDVGEMMVSLQRSAISFRRQGSSGLVWDDTFFSAEISRELNQEVKLKNQLDGEKENPKVPRPPQTEHSGADGESNIYHTVKDVSPVISPPSPKVSGCNFCCMLATQ